VNEIITILENTDIGDELFQMTNVVFRDYIKTAEMEHFVFSCFRNKKELFVRIMYANDKIQGFMASMEMSSPFIGHVPLYFWLGVEYGPIRWGTPPKNRYGEDRESGNIFQ
jgi:hypothetical protein